jgi:hypothetical protein
MTESALIERRKRKEQRLRRADDQMTLALDQTPLTGKEREAIVQTLSSLYAEWRNAWTQEHSEHIAELLKQAGIDVNVRRCTGDNAFPTEYTLSIGSICATGPTFDLALVWFMEQLIKQHADLLRECRSLFEDDEFPIEDMSDDWYEHRNKALARIAAIIGEDE